MSLVRKSEACRGKRTSTTTFSVRSKVTTSLTPPSSAKTAAFGLRAPASLRFCFFPFLFTFFINSIVSFRDLSLIFSRSLLDSRIYLHSSFNWNEDRHTKEFTSLRCMFSDYWKLTDYLLVNSDYVLFSYNYTLILK